MGLRGRPSLKNSDYSDLNYLNLSDFEKRKIVIDLLSKAPRGLFRTEIIKKSMTEQEVKRILKELINEGVIVGPYYNIYFHTKWLK